MGDLEDLYERGERPSLPVIGHGDDRRHERGEESDEAATSTDVAPPVTYTDWSSLNRDIDGVIDDYVAARGSAQPLPQDFAAAFAAAMVMRHGDLASSFNDKCTGPFPSALLKKTVDAASNRMKAEDIALALAPYCSDPENFETEVIDATCLSETMSFKKSKMLDALASRHP